jgi:hypothetical protein
MKICKECEIEKPLTEYYAHNAMADGYLNKCRDCVRLRVSKNTKEKSEYYKEYDRKRGMLPNRVEARKKYAKTEQGKEAIKRAHKKYKESYPARDFARIAVNNAVRDGKLQKLPCFICGDVAEAHHPDYGRPLDVVWLCNTHHREAHLIK